MFKKLRNKFILHTMIVSTIVLVVAFLVVFISASVRLGRPPHPVSEYSDRGDMPEMTRMLNDHIAQDRKESLDSLGFTLIGVGLSVELIIFVLSYVYAEAAIRPVQQAYESQRDFITNASHELKTPIAAVRANFEALDSKEEPWASNIDVELSRASSLVGDLLCLARSEGDHRSEKTVVDITTIINQRIDLAKARLGEKRLVLNLPEKKELKMVSADFVQIFDILFDNAIKYSAKKVEVSFSDLTLCVKNDGKSIPKDKLEQVFERFYQVDKTAEGSGLGLSIAGAVASRNNWRIWAESDKNCTSFKLSLK